MHPSSLVPATFILAIAMNAGAQTSPPVRPGLWEITAEHSIDGKRPMTLAEKTADLTPAQKAWVERTAERHGNTQGTANVSRTCLSAEVLATQRWHGATPKCVTRYSVQDATTWKWHSTCQQNEADGEAFFDGPDRYRTNTVISMNGNGVPPHVVKVNASMRWLGPDCAGAQ